MNDRPSGVSGGEQTQATEAASLEEQKEYAERKVGAARTMPITRDDIAALLAHCDDFIRAANLKEHNRMMADSKMREMIFWITAGKT